MSIEMNSESLRAAKQASSISPEIHVGGPRVNMTPEMYIAIRERCKNGDYSDLPKIFVFAPPKSVSEMSLEEKIEHKEFLEEAIRILKVYNSFVVEDLHRIASEATAEERKEIMQYEKKHGPKAKQMIEKRERIKKNEDAIERASGVNIMDLGKILGDILAQAEDLKEGEE